MTTVIEQGRVCIDCALILANGEDSCEGDCQHALSLPIGAVLDHQEGEHEEFFKPWRPCPGCGTTLAGTWLTYAVLA